jgi:DNA-binding transcriptional LysR family regulator
MHRFSLRQLEYLTACIDHRSIAKAADTLNVSQPTISVAIAKLEDQLGVQLLLRHHAQGVVATANAEKILHSARALLTHATDLERQTMMTGTAVSGDLRLGSFVTLAPVILPKLIHDLSNEYPDIHLQIKEGTQEYLLEGLQAGRLEMALLYDLELPPDIRKTQLAEFSPYVALPASHPLAQQASVGLSELINEPLILLDVPPSREYFIGLFKSAGFTPNIAHSSPSLELVRGMVGYGLGYSLLVTRPQGDLTYDGQEIVARPLRDRLPKTNVVLASLKSLRPTQLMRSLENLAIQIFRE